VLAGQYGMDAETLADGFGQPVAAAMANGDGLFWVAPVDLAAHQIVTAIESRRAHAYVTKRWRVVAAIMRFVPEWIYNRL